MAGTSCSAAPPPLRLNVEHLKDLGGYLPVSATQLFVEPMRQLIIVYLSMAHLSDKLIVLQLLPALHNSHNASLNLVLPVLINLEGNAIEKNATRETRDS